MSLFLALTAFVFASGICVLVVGLLRAPVGHEDQDGFHAVRAVKVSRPQPRSVVLDAALPEMSAHV